MIATLSRQWVTPTYDLPRFFRETIDEYCDHLKDEERVHLREVLVNATKPANYSFFSFSRTQGDWIRELKSSLYSEEEHPFKESSQISWKDAGNALLFHTGFFPEYFEEKGRSVLRYYSVLGRQAYLMQSEVQRNTHPGLSARMESYGRRFRDLSEAITEIREREKENNPISQAIAEAQTYALTSKLFNVPGSTHTQ